MKKKLTDTFINTGFYALAVATCCSISLANSSPYNDYWHQGKAEVSRYALEQARYGEIHTGDAVLVFVTEDFSKSKQVKLDRPRQSMQDRVPVMKLNVTKKFNTGIYPYSMMMSVFTPASQKNGASLPTLKISASSQEWCGNTFTQINREKNHYRFEVRSYFETVGDQSGIIDSALLEDGVWTQIRLNPEQLPIGEKQMVPGTFYQRLMHTDMKAERVVLSHETHASDTNISIYTIDYPDLKRHLRISYEKAFPYTIKEWTEEYKSGWGTDAKILKTHAVQKKSIMTDYWNKNKNSDSVIRAKLGLK